MTVEPYRGHSQSFSTPCAVYLSRLRTPTSAIRLVGEAEIDAATIIEAIGPACSRRLASALILGGGR